MKRILTAAILLTSVLAGSQVFARSAFAGDAQHYYQVVWNDVQKPWRANSEINAAVAHDSDACEAVAGEQHGAFPGLHQVHGRETLELGACCAAAFASRSRAGRGIDADTWHPGSPA